MPNEKQLVYTTATGLIDNSYLDPAVFNNRGDVQNYVVSGLLSTAPVNSLTATNPGGTASVEGKTVIASASSISYTPSRLIRNYLLLNGTVTQLTRIAGAEMPLEPANSVLLEEVATDVTKIVSVVDFRNLQPLANERPAFSYDYKKLLLDLEITTGTYAGAFRYSGNNKIIWYFSNLALLNFVDIYPAKVKAYLNLYISRLEVNRSIMDIAPDLVTKVAPDSHDSYASTFLMLAAKYVRATQDLVWFNANLVVLKQIADSNLVTQIKSAPVAGLTSVFQAGSTINGQPASLIGYLMDNCESYRGLKDFSDILTATGNTADGTYYNGFATTVANGVGGLWDATNNVWLWADVVTTGNTGKLFYPALTAQIFPELWDVPLVAAPDKYAFGYQYLNVNAPSWWQKKYDGFPWLILGYFATLRRKDPLRGEKMLDFINKYFLPQVGTFTIENIGYYKAIQDLLVDPSIAKGIVPLYGTRNFFVAATSAGSPTTKLTFIDGILTSTLS